MELKVVNKIENTEADFFIRNFMKRSKPVILKDFILQDSPALKKWDYPYFKKLAGDITIDVYGVRLRIWTALPVNRLAK